MPDNSLPIIVMLEIRSDTDFPVDFHCQYHTHLFCHSGQMQFLFNEQKMTCKSGQFLFWFAESRLTGLNFSKAFRATVLLVEKVYLMDNIPDQSWSLNAQLHSKVYPVKGFVAQNEKIRILNNFKWLFQRFTETDHLFYKEALKLQMQLFLLDMWYTFAKEYERRKHSLQTGTLYERFMQLLSAYCMQQREVQFYSRELNISPKYLNHLSKIHSGLTASEWIQRYAKERIIVLLQNRSMNIAEIAFVMEFSSRSFFTRYVKKILGVTPSEYRQRLW
jgi:AraC family transcriptional activator of pobA